MQNLKILSDINNIWETLRRTYTILQTLIKFVKAIEMFFGVFQEMYEKFTQAF